MRKPDFRAQSVQDHSLPLTGTEEVQGMKITVDVECTPDEARAFLGLPNVAPLQDAMMRQLHERMSANLQAMDIEALFKTWLPVGVQSFEQLQKMFWAAASGGGSEKKRGDS